MLYIVIALFVWAAILGRTMQVWGAWRVARDRARALEDSLGVPLTDRGDVELVTQLGSLPLESSRPLALYVAGRKAHDIPMDELHVIRHDLRRRHTAWRIATTTCWVATAVACVVNLVHPGLLLAGVAGGSLVLAVAATVAARTLQDMHDTIVVASITADDPEDSAENAAAAAR
ncbi:hypothetical protein C1Y63_08955 [Corynebacterium sp. 13CS0277]|uniref:hypothetical protein n=1 Tax=Corynebacterium sp. 13CS0277 TaxID=2071994 RepID=UPI000D036700|nr:hypothetical protein [Corynebacterium sp. 13CS0277]PRQ10863.1 hypothetical protein C1Y63_08955 [Corynebacterium sp. 13CS0277]